MLKLVEFKKGDSVTVTHGTFEGYRGVITQVLPEGDDKVVWYMVELEVNNQKIPGLYTGNWINQC